MRVKNNLYLPWECDRLRSLDQVYHRFTVIVRVTATWVLVSEAEGEQRNEKPIFIFTFPMCACVFRVVCTILPVYLTPFLSLLTIRCPFDAPIEWNICLTNNLNENTWARSRHSRISAGSLRKKDIICTAHSRMVQHMTRDRIQYIACCFIEHIWTKSFVTLPLASWLILEKCEEENVKDFHV